MAESPKRTPDLKVAARNLRDRDPLAFLLPPRIVRRVIKQDRALPGFGFRVPHRKSYVLQGERLRQFVALDELGLTSVAEIPETVLLIAEPKESELAGMEQADLHRWISRLHFHARVHHQLERRFASHARRVAAVRSRIDRIGQAEFDEARAVLQQEHFLIGRPDLERVYIEFAAVFLEDKQFSPQRLGWYFPSCEDAERVAAIITEDLDVTAILALTQAVDPSPPATSVLPPNTEQQTDRAEVTAETLGQSATTLPGRTITRAATRSRKLANRAMRADRRGNTVRAVILHTHAALRGDAETAVSSRHKANDALDRFVTRLNAALEFDQKEAAEWRELLADLLEQSTRGFWNADRRMFYDLQKVCLDHERAVFRIDLLEWVRSRGRRPLKRPLENQREVLMVKHLRSALRRLNASGLSTPRREKFAQLLHVAVDSAEHQLRERLRPLVDASLRDVGFQATNLPERVAAGKLTEELLDAIVKRGYLTMAVLRDGLSRSQLKLPDLADLLELWKGDRLLQADRQLSESLDGVYRRGPFYLRWMQRLSSLAFGTIVGRWLTLFAILPLGGAYVSLSFIAHAVEKVGIHAESLLHLETVIAGGIFLLGLIHWRAFRMRVRRGLAWLMKVLGSILIDMPVWAIRNPGLRRFLRSPAVVFLRRYVILPGLLSILFCWGLPELRLYQGPSLPTAAAVYLGFAVLLNSRIGRDVEELTADWLENSWHQIRTRFFLALFDFVMRLFRTLMELVERFLYAVDEWLRFKSGESRLMFWTKAIAGVVWALVSFFVVFFITLMAEPQLNPIKHFPVVTVSHKIILPMQPVIKEPMVRPLGKAGANLVALFIVTLTPGVFGFLVWELRSNWRLYLANRPRTLLPAIIGDHGETLIRLLKSGFHSGTLPKLFAKIRHAVRTAEKKKTNGLPAKYREALHHLDVSVRHFVEREFLGPLRESGSWTDHNLRVGRIVLSSNSISVDFDCSTLCPEPLGILFQEQSGWLVAGMQQRGWFDRLDETERDRLEAALSGLYKLSGVDIVREQIANSFQTEDLHYDVSDRNLVIWPSDSYATEIHYDLDARPNLIPHSISESGTGTGTETKTETEKDNDHAGFEPLCAEQVLFSEQPISWEKWVAYWESPAATAPPTSLTAYPVIRLSATVSAPSPRSDPPVPQ